MIKFFNLSRQYKNLREEIREVTDSVLTSGQVMNGSYTKHLEQWLAEKNNCKYAVTVHSGTSALEVQAEYYKKLSGKKRPTVAIPSITFAASANAYMRAGWDVTLLDCDDYGLSRVLEDAHYDLILLIGIYGHSVAPLIPDSTQCDRFVEDGAQHWLSEQCKRHGDSTTISFDPTKNLGNYGNGGAIVTNNADLYKFAGDWKNHGKSSYKGTGNTPDTQMCGTNSRMSEQECAQMVVKSKYIDQWQSRRKKIASYWIERMNRQGVRTLIDDSNFEDHCYHKFVIDVNNRDKLAQHLKDQGIDTKIHYNPPLYKMDCFSTATLPADDCYANTYVNRILSLPIYPELTDSEVEHIADQVLAGAC